MLLPTGLGVGSGILKVSPKTISPPGNTTFQQSGTKSKPGGKTHSKSRLINTAGFTFFTLTANSTVSHNGILMGGSVIHSTCKSDSKVVY